eukprot:2373790-Prymnesium_polylepis.2
MDDEARAHRRSPSLSSSFDSSLSLISFLPLLSLSLLSCACLMWSPPASSAPCAALLVQKVAEASRMS